MSQQKSAKHYCQHPDVFSALHTIPPDQGLPLLSMAVEIFTLSLSGIPEPSWKPYLGRGCPPKVVWKPLLPRTHLGDELSFPEWDFWNSVVTTMTALSHLADENPECLSKYRVLQAPSCLKGISARSGGKCRNRRDEAHYSDRYISSCAKPAADKSPQLPSKLLSAVLAPCSYEASCCASIPISCRSFPACSHLLVLSSVSGENLVCPYLSFPSHEDSYICFCKPIWYPFASVNLASRSRFLPDHNGFFF